MHSDAFVAANRFGLGARPGELRTLVTDPRGWLLDQLSAGDPIAAALSTHIPSTETIQMFAGMRSAADKAQLRKQREQVFRSEMADRCSAAVATDAPFRERWVRYWSNHFTVSVARKEVVGLAGAFEREAIRAHCTGRFSELLAAAVLHPAMLLYLDNTKSVGPNSKIGRQGRRGLNENLAREILELHTVGVDGGYAQADVENLAQVLTGWSVDLRSGGTAFAPERHEPGDKQLLGKRLPAGPAGARQALELLARHPATAHYVAWRLARHFVADDPPAGAIASLARTFRDTDGDLTEVAHAVVHLADAWIPLTKVKSPEDLVLSTARGLELQEAGEALLASLRWLGHAPFAANSPQGFPDTTTEWLGPEALLSRITWAEEVARQVSHRIDPLRRAEDLLGGLLRSPTRAEIMRAPRDVGLALFLASPCFQRR